MPKTYEKAQGDVLDMARDLIAKHHEHLLVPNKVKIDYIMVFAARDEDGNMTGPALTHHGYPADGIAKIISAKDRAKGMGDCEISLDGDRWSVMKEDQQAALLDHELTHFQLKCDSSRVPRVDDLRRPLLKMKKHDFDFGWFTCIAERHGLASSEVRQAKIIWDNQGQAFFPEIYPALAVGEKKKK